MYASRTTQFIVGIFAILGIVALAILSFSLGKISLVEQPGYTLYANFDNIAGLKTGNQIELAGVEIGKVAKIGLHDARARVALRIQKGVQIDNDAIAGVKSAGLLGDKYVSIALGPGDKILKDGDIIRETQSSFVLEDAIGQVINNIGSGGGSKESEQGADKSPPAEKPAPTAKEKGK
ncbi:MAG: outer membrane lipid asymmetry maintenance protein MlaD [Candidatus Binatus sp.]|uniref:outer membrane lipid asymmetry maintenance protein MlaD n=1 Tax=Candidatus Binatus sp. TaxID=2811406 RepID=UPI0027266A3E|nr:outer membrane lipid asymmetry maintenance protein MlaD [Candidatus Binatus sp.]MDO8434555.1 outer membrane lipid asymmetry maintenance protein MlaD [Candidatus Binatus sp.]